MIKYFSYISVIDVSYLTEKSELIISLILNTDQEAWKAFLRDMTEAEYQQLLKLRTSDAKNSFCFGKISAKMAISKLNHHPVNEISIDHGIFGFPLIYPHLKGYHISIAHTANSGIAICYNEKYLIGIDLEKVELTNDQTILTSLTDKEIKMKFSMDLPDTLFYHILWSAREALSKAIRTGYLISLPLLEVKSISTISNYHKIEFEHFNMFVGIVLQVSDQVIALVIPQKLTVNTDFIEVIIKQSELCVNNIGNKINA